MQNLEQYTSMKHSHTAVCKEEKKTPQNKMQFFFYHALIYT